MTKVRNFTLAAILLVIGIGATACDSKETNSSEITPGVKIEKTAKVSEIGRAACRERV